MDSISIIISGPAGEGILQAGRLFGRTLARLGYNVFIDSEYPSLIRGGLNASFIRFGYNEVRSFTKRAQILVAFSSEALKKFYKRLSDKGVLIYDPKTVREVEESDELYIPIPMLEEVKKIGAPPIVKNSLALGALIYLLGLKLETLYEVLEKTFAGKSNVIEFNKKAAEIGFKYMEKEHPNLRGIFKVNSNGGEKILLTGNEAIGLASIKAGLKFFSAYPITPATPLFHFLLRYQERKNFVVIQAENELAAINMALGASYAGARSMVATSGTGFSLMVEGFGASAMTECPVVVVLAMRPGPGSGMPTFTTQSDLRFVLHASHGEFARVVVAPGDVEEAFYLTGEAFNIADKFQLPVVILIDKFLAEGLKTVDKLDEDKIIIDRGKIANPPKLDGVEVFPRYKPSEDFVSERIFPGVDGWIVNANVTEHDETGWSKITPDVREVMAQKRIRKIESVKKYISGRGVKFYGKVGEPTIVSWGSTKGPILDAIEMLKEDGVSISFLQVVYLSPFPEEEIKKYLEKTDEVILIENNYTGQLESLLKENLFLEPKYKLLRDNGLPYHPEEIYEFVKGVLK